ncbi:MAG: hypothetical protein AAGK37_15830 [Pseudomonadota bacterium]
MTTTKLNIEMSGLKVSFEGPTEFLDEKLAEVCEKLSSLGLPSVDGQGEVAPRLTEIQEVKMSTTDIAVKLTSKSGPDLIMAAAAHLRFVKRLEDFKRGELLAEMKSAKSFYRQTYSNNLSKSLEGLVKGGRLSNPATETYALPHTEEEGLRAKLDL